MPPLFNPMREAEVVKWGRRQVKREPPSGLLISFSVPECTRRGFTMAWAGSLRHTMVIWPGHN